MQVTPNNHMSGISDVEDISEDQSWKEALLYRYLHWLRTAPTPRADLQSQDITELKRPVRWLASALADVARIAELLPDWDGHGSPALGAKEREQVTRLLSSIDNADVPAPNIVPIAGGGIQIEWQHEGRELELEIVTGSEDIMFLKVHEDGSMEENTYPVADWDRMKELLDWFAERVTQVGDD